MSDKPLTQQRLARDLADLLHVLHGKENFLGFVDAFWKTMAHEWGGIDALRMDKFLYVVRCYISQGFERVSKRQWADGELLERYVEILESVPFNATNAKIPNGLRYHVIELYVDELDKVDTSRTAPLDEILAPLRKLGEESPAKAVRERVREVLNDERLEDWQGVHAIDEASEAASEANDHGGVEAGRSLDEEGPEDGAEFGGFDD